MRSLLKGFLVCMLIVVIASSVLHVLSPIDKVKAEEQLWLEVNNGLYGGFIYSIVIDPDQTIYAKWMDTTPPELVSLAVKFAGKDPVTSDPVTGKKWCEY